MLFVLSTMKYTQFFGFVLIWVFKFLLFTECESCIITIEDPEWNNMWYLNNARPNGYDMNVLPAWRSCVNGTGVTVGVVDKGVEDHIDLNINTEAGYRRVYLNRSSQSPWAWRRYGYNTRNTWNRQLQESLKHGTRVAGIVAAKKNRWGIIGIAFGAEIADVRIASTAVFESFDANLLSHRSDVIDVYSCSFANFHTGTKTYPLLSSQKNALESGTTHGRGGLGSVYVFATGNSGGDKADVFRDSCSYDRLVTNRYVISVAGIQHNLQKLPNGEACSAMMVAAFTSKAGGRFNRVVTTDIRNRITSDFNQNSAAAPMVSGAVALALSANPALTYRDIMHLLVQTSRSDLREERYKSNFFTNAANFKVSSYFGFGLLDIGKLVERSKTWINVPRRQNCTARTTLNRRLNRDSIVVQVIQCSATYIEHVEISLKVNHQHAGQIKWVLVSPYGTKSTILPGRGLDPTTNMDITVLTVQLWGENPIGYWRLEPTAVFGKRLDQGTVESVELSIHGYACVGQYCLPAAEQDPAPQTVRPLPEQNQRTRNIVSPLVTERSHECPSRLQSRCVEQCSNDRDCHGKICCNNGCGHTCEWSISDQRTRNVVSPVVTEKSGECPSTLENSCVERCSYDTQCYGQKKCCYNGCGHTCEWPRIYQTQQTVRTLPEQVIGIWGEWSQCSVSCGYGTRIRERQCAGSCNGNHRESKSCYTPCPSHICSDTWNGCSDYVTRNGCPETDYLIYDHCRRTCGYCY